VEGQRDAEVQALRAAKEKAEHAMAALHAELATIKMECQVAISAVNKYKGSLVDVDTENWRLVWELEKVQALAHANVKPTSAIPRSYDGQNTSPYSQRVETLVRRSGRIATAPSGQGEPGTSWTRILEVG
jgi:hypothetical protein